MEDLLLVASAGFCASLVDGALGMGFGPTSSSILLGTGLSPTSVSTTVNLAKVATGIAAAISHWRFRNIDHRLVLKLAIPGSIGALIGVTILSNVDAAVVKPALAVLLVVIGLRILWRFSQPVTAKAEEFEDLEGDPDAMPPFDDRGVELVATAGGVTNGMIGAWGPVVTPFLMGRDLAPRFAVGSVNTAEVAVAAMSVTSLLAVLSGDAAEVLVGVASELVVVVVVFSAVGVTTVVFSTVFSAAGVTMVVFFSITLSGPGPAVVTRASHEIRRRGARARRR